MGVWIKGKEGKVMLKHGVLGGEEGCTALEMIGFRFSPGVEMGWNIPTSCCAPK